MIENIRKFKGLIIVGLALVVFGLVLGIKDDLFRGGAGGRGMLRIDGRTYYEKDFNILGSGALEVISSLAGSGDFSLYQYVIALSTGAADRNSAAESFFTNRMLIRNAAERMGVFVGDKEVAEQIRSMRAFSGPGENGTFNEEAYRNFVERGIGRLGMTENDFHGLIGDYLAFDKMMAILGSGLVENRDVTRTRGALESQQLGGEIAHLMIDSFEQAAEPTEEKLKEYWENLRDAFTTEERRKFTYLIVSPVMPEEPKEEKETIADATLTEEQTKAKEEEKAKKAADLAKEKRDRQMEIGQKVESFSSRLEGQQGAGFEDLAKEFGWEVKTTELFAKSKPPTELDLALRSSSGGGRAVDELFKVIITSDPVSKLTLPIAVGETQWLIARLDEVEEPREKIFEEARDEARLKYVKEKAKEAMEKKAKEASEQIKVALREGKSFGDAAKAAGLDGIKSVEKVGASYQADPATEPSSLFQKGRYVTPGELAEPIIEDDRAFVFLVSRREVVKNPNPESLVDSQVRTAESSNRYTAFNDWLTELREGVKVEQLYRN